MNVRASVEIIKYISQDMKDISKQLEGISAELEDVREELGKQSEFKTHIRKLEEAGEKLGEEKKGTGDLAQVLANIGSLYQRTEANIEKAFENGGENGWRR